MHAPVTPVAADVRRLKHLHPLDFTTASAPKKSEPANERSFLSLSPARSETHGPSDFGFRTSAQVLATFVPAFPVYPPETAWMREPKTDLPGLIPNSPARAGRVVFLPADLDRRFGRDNLPDQCDLLTNLIRWTTKDTIPLAVEGAGLVDCPL